MKKRQIHIVDEKSKNQEKTHERNFKNESERDRKAGMDVMLAKEKKQDSIDEEEVEWFCK